MAVVFLHGAEVACRDLLPGICEHPDRPGFPAAMLLSLHPGKMHECCPITDGAEILVLNISISQVPTSKVAIQYWGFTLGALTGLRWLRFDFVSASDERAISEALGLPPYTIAAIMMICSLFVVWLLIDVHRSNQTLL